MLKQRSMQQPGGNAISHPGATAGNDVENDRRNKEKQPSETELK